MVNRFTDPTPFTPLSALSPEAREWHIKVANAKAREKQGDRAALQELIELGVYPPNIEEIRAQQDGVADKEISVELDKATIDDINKRIALGHTYARISKELGLDWWTVRNHAKAGWLGTKVQITIRLNKLATEGDPKEREKLVKQINERVTYLYEGGKALGKTIDKIEKTING